MSERRKLYSINVAGQQNDGLCNVVKFRRPAKRDRLARAVRIFERLFLALASIYVAWLVVEAIGHFLYHIC